MADRIERIQKSAEDAPYPRPASPDEFRANALKANAVLAELLKESELTFDEFLAFHLAWYFKAGHRALGRLYVALAKTRTENWK